MGEFEGVPHARKDEIRYWEDRADEALAVNEKVMGIDGLGITGAELAELAWQGLKESVDGGWRTPAEAEQTYFDWFKKHHG